jgi:hypothetical protein
VHGGNLNGTQAGSRTQNWNGNERAVTVLEEKNNAMNENGSGVTIS